MKQRDNYRLQVEEAKKHFLRYDQNSLIAKLNLRQDPEYLYTQMLRKAYRLHRGTGNVERLDGDWAETNDHGEVMTLLDLICDSRTDRYPAHRWQNMSYFSAVYHRSLLEETEDPLARAVQADQPGFCRVCSALGGKPGPGGDISYALPFFEGLWVAIQFWQGDDEFPPRIRWLWDENAGMYLKYETMWYALGLLRRRIHEEMKPKQL